MRLIDADEYKKRNAEIIDCEIDHHKYQDTLRELIDDSPTIDAVPVVRCKDCKHFESQTENTGVCDGGFCHAPMHVAVIDFCSYGERKDDE